MIYAIQLTLEPIGVREPATTKIFDSQRSASLFDQPSVCSSTPGVSSYKHAAPMHIERICTVNPGCSRVFKLAVTEQNLQYSKYIFKRTYPTKATDDQHRHSQINRLQKKKCESRPKGQSQQKEIRVVI